MAKKDFSSLSSKKSFGSSSNVERYKNLAPKEQTTQQKMDDLWTESTAPNVLPVAKPSLSVNVKPINVSDFVSGIKAGTIQAPTTPYKPPQNAPNLGEAYNRRASMTTEDIKKANQESAEWNEKTTGDKIGTVVGKTIATPVAALAELGAGVATGLEGAMDFGATIGSAGVNILRDARINRLQEQIAELERNGKGDSELANKLRQDIIKIENNKNVAEKSAKKFVGEQWVQDYVGKPVRQFTEEYSYLPSKAGEIIGGAGAILPSVANAGSIAKSLPQATTKLGQLGTKIATMLPFAAQAAGSSSEEAINEGASLYDATKYGLASGTIEAGVEMISGGIGGLAGGKIASSKLSKEAVKRISNNLIGKYALKLADAGIDMAGEGFEEVLSTAINPYLKRLTYDERAELASNEELTQSFIDGVLTSLLLKGGQGALSVTANKKANAEIKPNLTQNQANEQQNIQPQQTIQPQTETAQKGEIQMPTAKTNAVYNTAKQLNVDTQLANRVMEMAKLTEVPVNGFVDVNPKIDGYYKDGAIYINKNSEKAQDRIFVHELTHNIEKADGWQGLRDTIFNSNVLYNELAEKGQTLDEYRQLIKDRYSENGIELNEDDVDREVIAKFAEEHLLKDQKSIERMVQENPTFMQRVKNFIDDLVVKFKGTAEEKELLKIQRMYDKAFAESKQVETSKTQKVQYGINDTVPKGYTRLYRGLNQEFDRNYDKKKIDNVNGYESWTDSYELAKSYGDNVYYIDIPTSEIKDSIIDENPQSGTYGDRNLMYVHDKKVGLKGESGKEYMLYTDHDNYANLEYKKADAPSEKSYSVNTDNQGRELSKQQQEYFKDSKVRDENGKLMEVYHGSGDDFTVFDIMRSSEKNDLGKGFYFTNSLANAQSYHQATNEDFESRIESRTYDIIYEENLDEDNVDDYNYAYDKAESELKSAKGKLIKSYLNITNPIVISEDSKIDVDEAIEIGKEVIRLSKKYGRYIDIQRMEQHLNLNAKNSKIGVSGFFNSMNTPSYLWEALKATGYDGIIDYTVPTKFSGNKGVDSNTIHYVAFNSNQIKNVDNLNPTENEDIRYSVETREVDLPEKVGDRYLSRHAKTLAESGVTMPETVDLIEKMVKDGSLTHERITDKKALAYAEKYIEENGFKDAVDHWNHLTKSNRELSKEELALGQLIFNTADTNQDVQLVKKMIADLVVKGTQAGRSLQAMSMVKKMTPDGRLYSLERTVQKLNQDLREQFGKDFKDIEIPDDLAEKLLKSKTTKETDAAVEEIQQYIADRVPATWGDKANAWRYLAMLGNPRTHIRNVLGNAVFIPAVEIKNLIATGIEKTLPKAERTKAVVGFKDTDLLNFAESDFDTHQEAVRGENKYDITAGVQEKQRVFNNKVLETLRKKNFELLEKEDATFLKYHYKRAMASALKARGITLKELRSGTPESIKKLDQVRQYAINEAQKATYRDFNSMANWVSSQKRRLKRASGTSKAAKVGSMVAEGIIPFTKTPANILKRGIEYSPVGLAKGIYDATAQVKKGKVTASQAIDEMAAGLTGTGIVMLGALLKSLGLIVGGDEEKQKEQNFEKLKGNQNYALKIGNKTYTIDWMAPSSMPLFVGVEVVDLLEAENISDIIGSIGNITDPVFELSMLQGLNSTMNTLGSDNPIAETFSNTVESYFGQYNPTFLGQIARTIDPKRRTTYADKNSVVPSALQTFAQKQLQKIPFASKTLPTYKDQFGRESETENVVGRIFSNFMSPGYLADVKDQPVENELTKLYEKTGESAILPSYATKSITVNKEKKNLTAKEYDTFAKVRGNVAYDNLEKLMTSQEYKSMDDEQKIKAIKKIYDYANSVGKSKVSDYELTKSEQQIQDYEKAGIDYYKWLILQDKADTNKNGYVTKDEMNKALNKSSLTSTQKALIKKNMNKSK